MDRKALEARGRNLLGWGWQSTLARGLGVDSRTVRRWGLDIAVPRYAEAMLESLDALREAGRPLPARWMQSGERRRARLSRLRALRGLCARAVAEHGARCLDNIAIPDRIGCDEALVIADALESQGDVSAFRLGRAIRALADQC